MAKPKHPRRTKAQWVKLIEDKQHSPLSIEAYCQQHHLSVSNFYVWRTRLKQSPINTLPQHSRPTANDWRPIDLPPPAQAAPSWDIELDLPGGMMLRMRTV